MKTTLADSSSLRLFALCSLYFAQGLPWGFVTITFAAWLGSPEQGLGRAEVGTIIGIASLPWAFKFVWGPMVDRFSIPGPARRRPWIIASQAAAILTLTTMLLIEDLPASINLLADDSTLKAWTGLTATGPLVMLVLLSNIFVSIQDVAVDALAIDLLTEEERGTANGMMYGCSYLGTAVGGAGLGWIVARYGIAAGVGGQAALLSTVLLIPLVLKERPALLAGRKETLQGGRLTNSNRQQRVVKRSHTTTASRSIFRNLITAFSLKSTLLGLVVAITVKIGIGFLTPVLIDYLQNDAEWSMEDYTEVVGGWAVAVGLTGSIAGGFLADRFGPHRIVIAASLLLSGTWAVFGIFPEWTLQPSRITAMLLIQELTLAVVTVGLFALFMAISWPKVAATQFTTYMAVMNLSNSIGSMGAGHTDENASISSCLYFAAGIQLVIMLPLLLISPNQTRQVLGSGTDETTYQ